MNVWLTSDPHYWHENIIDYCKRPFRTATKMNDYLIKKYNERVGVDDIVYFLGDLCLLGPASKELMHGMVRRMIGHKHLILGNHDKLRALEYVDEIGFESVHTSLELPKEYYQASVIYPKIMLIHDPAIATYWDTSVLWLCGHVHNVFKCVRNVVNVGVDQWNFAPVSIDEVLQFYVNELANRRKP